MRSVIAGASVAAALLALAACQSPEPSVKTAQTAPTTTITIASAPAPVVTAPATVVLAPNPPPQAQVEFVPPAPPNAPYAVWQPGHWRWSGANGVQWQWVAGNYVMAPPGYHAWVPGRWQPQPSGWMWFEGHWA
jgi:hypothetical protein